MHKKVALQFGDVDEGFAAADHVFEDRVLLRRQHPPAARTARHRGAPRRRRQAGRLLEHADAALRAPRAREGARSSRGAHPRDCHAQRRRLWRQERPVQSRGRGGQGRADPRPAGEDRADARRGLLLSPRAASGDHEVPDRREERRHAHGRAPADDSRRRRVRIVRGREHVLHRRVADGDLPRAALPVPGLPRVHEQGAVRSEARTRHAAKPVRPGSSDRQDRRTARRSIPPSSASASSSSRTR